MLPEGTQVWCTQVHGAYTASDPIPESEETVHVGERGRVGWHDTGQLGIFWEPEGRWGRWDLYPWPSPLYSTVPTEAAARKSLMA